MIALPIDPAIPELLERLRERRVGLVVAPPGSGKTTRVPPALLGGRLLAAEHPAVVLLQPRRVAARASAARIAEERGWRLGDEVGYHVRHDRRIGRSTRLRVVTEGILTRQLLDDPYLDGVGAVVLDEFHERSIHADLALAMLAEIRESVRPDLIVVVMSATIDAGPVARFLGDAPIVRAEGRAYPIEVRYRGSHGDPLVDRVARGVAEALDAGDDAGDILVFLPGMDEIRRSSRAVAPLVERHDLLALPLHGSLPAAEQDRALRPAARRKLILATNVAETSLTIDGVRTVVDSGLARVASFDPALGIDRLELARISRASASQRAGRAGRTAPGRCLRLWSEREDRGRPEFETPEIRRVDLAPTVLAVRAWGARDLDSFGWFEPPSAEALAAADRLLVMLGACRDGDGRPTDLGRRLLRWPIHPRLGRLLVEASRGGRSRDGAALAALIAEKDVVHARRPDRGPAVAVASGPGRGDSDLLRRLDLLQVAERSGFHRGGPEAELDLNAARQVARVRDDLARSIGRDRDSTDPVESDECLLRAVVAAYPDRVVRRRGPTDATGVMVGGRGVRLEAESVVREGEFFVAIDARDDDRAGRRESRVRLASLVRREWLHELFPGSIDRRRTLEFDLDRGAVVDRDRELYLDLVLRESTRPAEPSPESARVLAEAIGPRIIDLLRADPAASRWLDRLDFLRVHLPDRPWPDWREGGFGEELALACHGKTRVDQLRPVDLLAGLRDAMPHAIRSLMDREAPEAIVVPSGSRMKVEYEGGRAAVAVRFQEVFGWLDAPRLAEGRTPIVFHLLGPNFRPVQITDDLRSFWASTYHQVRKDLRARYPKHAWPDDPTKATPEARGGRRN